MFSELGLKKKSLYCSLKTYNPYGQNTWDK